MPRRWPISASATVRCWNSFWSTASPLWSAPASPAWTELRRMGCGSVPQPGPPRSAGIRRCRSAAAKPKRWCPVCGPSWSAIPEPSAGVRQRPAEDRERRVREALTVTEELQTQQADKARKAAQRAAKDTQKDQAAPATAKPDEERPKEPRASTTDAQARV